MNVLDEFKNYKRKFIQISHRTAILMHIFKKADDDFEDMILSDHKEYCKQNHGIDIYKEAADQFFKQFEGNECLIFVECLRDKCNEMLTEHEREVKNLKVEEIKFISTNTFFNDKFNEYLFIKDKTKTRRKVGYESDSN